LGHATPSYGVLIKPGRRTNGDRGAHCHPTGAFCKNTVSESKNRCSSSPVQSIPQLLIQLYPHELLDHSPHPLSVVCHAATPPIFFVLHELLRKVEYSPDCVPAETLVEPFERASRKFLQQCRVGSDMLWRVLACHQPASIVAEHGMDAPVRAGVALDHGHKDFEEVFPHAGYNKHNQRISQRVFGESVCLRPRDLTQNVHDRIDQRVDDRLLGCIHTTAGFGQCEAAVPVSDRVEIPGADHETP